MSPIMHLGRLVALVALCVVASSSSVAAPAWPVALEVAARPGPSPAALATWALAHDLAARLESSLPARRDLAWVDALAAQGPIPRLDVVADADRMTFAVRLTTPRDQLALPLAHTRDGVDVASAASEIARRLGWKAPAAAQALPDPEVAGLLLLLPERGLTLGVSPRALDLLAWAEERHDEARSASVMVAWLEAEKTASSLSEEGHCAPSPLVAAAITGDAAALAAALAELPENQVETLLFRTRGPGLATPLHLAASVPDAPRAAAAVQLLVKALPPPGPLRQKLLEARDGWGATPLLRALAAGNERAARLLLSAGARPGARSRDGVNTIHALALGELWSLAPLLVGRLGPGSLSARDARGRRPLDLAARSPSAARGVGVMLASGAPSTADAVAAACARGDLATAQRLETGRAAGRRASLVALDLGQPPVSSAAWASEPEERSAVPLAFFCALTLEPRPDAEAFAVALARGRPDLASALLPLGLAPGAERLGDGALLHLAARYRQPGLVRLLASLGADPTALDPSLSTPLEIAVDGGDRATITALLDVSQGRVDPMIALDRAWRSLADPEAFAVLLPALQAAPLAPVDEARIAVLSGDERALRRVLAAHPEVVDDPAELGLTLLHLAARLGRTALIPILVSAGERPAREVESDLTWHGRPLTGWTALHLAAFHGRIATYHALLALGAEPAVAADGTRPEDLLKFQGFDLGSLSSPGGWLSMLGVAPSGAENGVTPDIELPLPEKMMPSLPRPDAADRPPPITRPFSFVSLGGGILLLEPPGPELVVARADVAGGRDGFGVAAGWEEAHERCMATSSELAARLEAVSVEDPDGANGARYFREERRGALGRARAWAGRLLRARTPLTAGDGPSVLAAALLRLARVELELTAYRAASAVATEGLTLAGRRGPVAAALAMVAARAQRAQGALSAAESTLAGMEVDGLSAPAAAPLEHLRGLVLGELGRYHDAIRSLRRAATLRPEHLGTRLNLATLLGRAGARDESRALSTRLVTETELGPPLEQALAKFLDGSWRLAGGDLAARATLEAAFATLSRRYPRHPVTGRIALSLARVERLAGHPETASPWLDRARRALLRSDGEDSPILGQVRIEEAEVERAAGRLDEALAAGREAYALVVDSEELELVWPIEVALAGLYRALAKARPETAVGPLNAAIVLGKRAVATLGVLRDGVKLLGGDAARAFTEDRIEVWRSLARDLTEAGRYIEALAVLDGLRSEECLSLATRGDLKASAAPSLPPERLASARSAVDTDELARLSALSAERPLTPAETAKVAALRQALRERRRAFESWLTTLESSLADLPRERAQAIAALNLREVSSLQGTLARLGPAVAVLHYVFADDHLRVVMTTARGQVGRDATRGGAELTSLILALREQVVDPSTDPRPVARALYDQLIAPIAEDLKQERIDTLFLALDGPLRYLPVAALWDGDRWLVERFRIAHLARATLDKLERRPSPNDSVAAFGSARAQPGFAPLQAVKEELDAVVKVGPDDPEGALPGELRLDDAFTREALTASLEAHRHATYHIASHFVLGPASERDSFLLLGDGTRLTLEDIRLDLRFDGVDLLSLSACNTAVGEGHDGRELEGFASLALRQGARQVLATLWPVGDASTGRLMHALYRWQGLPRAQALRLAMLGLIQGAPLGSDAPASGLFGEPPWPATRSLEGDAHPFHWAPFILIGSWL